MSYLAVAVSKAIDVAIRQTAMECARMAAEEVKDTKRFTGPEAVAARAKARLIQIRIMQRFELDGE